MKRDQVCTCGHEEQEHNRYKARNCRMIQFVEYAEGGGTFKRQCPCLHFTPRIPAQQQGVTRP